MRLSFEVLYNHDPLFLYIRFYNTPTRGFLLGRNMDLNILQCKESAVIFISISCTIVVKLMLFADYKFLNGIEFL